MDLVLCMNHCWSDMADYLIERGYEVLVSEWHPIKRYGGRHTWRLMQRYPCTLAEPNAWGNLIAVQPRWKDAC